MHTPISELAVTRGPQRFAVTRTSVISDEFSSLLEGVHCASLALPLGVPEGTDSNCPALKKKSPGRKQMQNVLYFGKAWPKKLIIKANSICVPEGA